MFWLSCSINYSFVSSSFHFKEVGQKKFVQKNDVRRIWLVKKSSRTPHSCRTHCLTDWALDTSICAPFFFCTFEFVTLLFFFSMLVLFQLYISGSQFENLSIYFLYLSYFIFYESVDDSCLSSLYFSITRQSVASRHWHLF